MNIFEKVLQKLVKTGYLTNPFWFLWPDGQILYPLNYYDKKMKFYIKVLNAKNIWVLATIWQKQ